MVQCLLFIKFMSSLTEISEAILIKNLKLGIMDDNCNFSLTSEFILLLLYSLEKILIDESLQMISAFCVSSPSCSLRIHFH